MSSHDNAYKHLFSHPQAVRDLLRGFVQEDWVELLDWGTLEKVSGSYVSDDLRDREDDVIWRIQLRKGDAAASGEWVYVYLLLEFQSSVDAHMAVRILTYIGLLYQDLIKSGQAKAGGKLPAVFPLVLYNGERTWTAQRELQELIEPVPASLEAYRPRLRYFLLDAGRLSKTSLQQPDNVVASLVRIERLANPEQLGELQEVIQQLVQQLKAQHNTGLRRAFTVWINRVVLGHLPPHQDEAQVQVQDLSEVPQMIGERIERWKQELVRQGVRQGVEQGVQQGVRQGKLEGKLEGQAEMLRRLLVRRFGELPEAVQAQIGNAHPQQLQQWFDRAVDAPSLEAVFGLH